MTRPDRFFDVSELEPAEVTLIYPWRDTFWPGSWAASNFAVVIYDERGLPQIQAPGLSSKYCRFGMDALCARLIAEEYARR